jgi:hypothetical protein
MFLSSNTKYIFIKRTAILKKWDGNCSIFVEHWICFFWLHYDTTNGNRQVNIAISYQCSRNINCFSHFSKNIDIGRNINCFSHFSKNIDIGRNKYMYTNINMYKFTISSTDVLNILDYETFIYENIQTIDACICQSHMISETKPFPKIHQVQRRAILIKLIGSTLK